MRIPAIPRSRGPWPLAPPVPPFAILAALAALGFGWLEQPARAEPVNGISLAAGYAYHYESPLLSSSGLSIAGDEQYVLREDEGITFNPLVLFSQETAEGRTAPTVQADGTTKRLPITGLARHLAIALQVRKFVGSFYVGGQYGFYYQYYEDLFAPSSRPSTGYGFAFGWEGASGWVAGGQVDYTQGLPLSGSGDPPYGVRLHVGYRWH